jgi:hypothetical protein
MTIKLETRMKALTVNCLRLIIGSVLLAVVLPIPLNAETIKLKDGTVVDGALIAEDDQQLTLEVKMAGGTMTAKRTYKKSEIAEIVRPTAEQKAQAEMQAAYEAARKNQLDPNSSFQLAQYDKVLNDIFAPFLSKYPNSPHVAEILKLSEEWQNERDQVAAGKGKARGQWMSAADAAKLIAQDRAQYHLQQGRALLTQGKTEQAIQQFKNAASISQDTATVNEANALQSQTYQQWLMTLQKEKRSLESELPNFEWRYKNAQESLQNAEKNLADYRRSISKSTYNKSAQESNLDRYKQNVDREKAIVAQMQTELTTRRNQIANLDRQLADLKNRAAAVPASQPVAQAAPTLPTETRVASVEKKPAPAAPAATAPRTSAATPSQMRDPEMRPPPMVTAMPRPDELESVLNSKVTVPKHEVSKEGPKYSPVRLRAVTLTGEGTPLMVIGLIVAGIGGIWLIVLAFKESAIWGICVMFVPLASFIFACIHFAESKWALLINVAGWVLIYVGAAMV